MELGNCSTGFKLRVMLAVENVTDSNRNGYVTKLRRRLPRLGHFKIQLYVICSLEKNNK